MGIEKIFEENVERREAVDEIRSVIRQSIDESAKQAINEKYKKKVEEEKDEEDESDGDGEKDDKKSDDDDGEEEEEDESESIKEEEETPYDRFFNKTLKLWNVDSPDELSGEEEKDFYDYIDKNWDADNEKEKEDSVDESINEGMEVTASRTGGRKGQDKFTINRLSDLKKLGKSRQYDYFMVTKKNGDEIEYAVDPQGNIVEM